MDYGFEHQGKVYTPNGTAGITPEDSTARNAAIESAELAAWDMRPSVMLGYYSFPAESGPNVYRSEFPPRLTGAKVTSWQGKDLGYIVSARVYRHSFGGRMVSLTVRGTNGATYYGRASYDWGTCVNLRRAR